MLQVLTPCKLYIRGIRSFVVLLLSVLSGWHCVCYISLVYIIYMILFCNI